MAKEGLTTKLICELHRLVCEDEWIPINDPKGGIAGFAKAGEYRTTPSSAPSELKKDARRLFIPPNDIVLKMEQLVATMNNILATKLPKDTMVENILAFLVELSTIHPFPNQNWRVILSLVELLAYQTKLEPFCISYINKVNPKLLIRSVEETILYQTVQPLLTIISRYKNEQHISIDDNEGIGSFFGYTKRQNPDEILHKTIHSLFPPLQNKRVLDAGCGSGTYTKYFIENGASVVGIDASNLAISRAKQTITGEVSFLLGNLEQPLSYLKNESFDFIFSNLVIHYVLDWDRLFRDFFRILKFGSSAIIVVPHPNRNVVNDYFAVEKVSEVFYTETANINIEYYRRPFQMMLNPMTQAGFQIKNTIEFNQEANEQTSVLFFITKNAALTTAKTHMEHTLDIAKYAFNTGDFPVGGNCINTTQTIDEASITLIIRKIFDDYDEKNGVQQKTDYTQRAQNIVQAWTQSMAKEGLTTQLICELHRLVCNDEAIAIRDEQGNILGYTDAGAYRTHPSSRKSELRVGARRLFLPPEVIASKLEQLVSIMNTVLATKLSQEQMIENVLSFAVEFSTIHPFANQNGRMMQLLMELIAYQAELKPFYVSRVNKLNSYRLTRAIEETILYQTVEPLRTLLNQYSKVPTVENSIDTLVKSNTTNEYWTHETLYATLYKSLFPKYEELLIGAVGKKEFEQFIASLTSFVFDKYASSTELTLAYFQKLHTFFYAKDFKIIVHREGKCYETLAGEWRKQPFLPQIQTHFTSEHTNIENDLKSFTDAYNALDKKTIFDVLNYYFDFLRVHPFSDSNLTVISLIVDIECLRLGFEPLNILKIRFKNKAYQYDIVNYYEKNANDEARLEKAYRLIVDYHKASIGDTLTCHICVDDSPSIGNYFAHSQSVSSNVILQDTEFGLLLPTLKDKKILDAGCGIGTYAKYFVENGATVIGIDASQVAIDKAKQMSLEQATFMVGDLEKPLDSFDNESFDFIFSYLVIHYIEDWDRLFKDFFRMLKVGGSILIAVSHPSKNVVSDYFSVEKTTETFYRNGQTISIEYYRRPLQNMLNTMINAGFQLDKTIEFKHKVVDRFYIAFRLYKHTSGLPSDTTMEQALGMAKQAFDAGDFPVGSVMVSHGEVISKARNEIFTKNNYHHAEINLIAKSLSYQNVEHKVVYVTLEPCWRCAQALVDFGVKEVFYILEDPLGGGAETLKKSNVKMTKLGEYEKKYTELLLAYFTNNPQLPQHIAQYKALYEHVKNNISKEKPDV
ncbi:methyltransferase domain-containing protein [Sulfurospirillum oryzae]|uniref:methyltransferase domain-containing protein n=1 Tax=Sulfurospirillum oryzae TaxID=2976535 RepID=UPI0021E6F6D9|nr:methyltransferase domain-containing protein [Sulfurospirillum oryzae]